MIQSRGGAEQGGGGFQGIVDGEELGDTVVKCLQLVENVGLLHTQQVSVHAEFGFDLTVGGEAPGKRGGLVGAGLGELC